MLQQVPHGCIWELFLWRGDALCALVVTGPPYSWSGKCQAVAAGAKQTTNKGTMTSWIQKQALALSLSLSLSLPMVQDS